MSTKVIIAAPHQDAAAELAGLIAELEDATVVDIADTSARLERLVGTHEPEVAFVHEGLGPVSSMDTVRTLVARYPGTAVLVVADNPSSDLFAAAMDAGARGVLARPLVLEELVQRFDAAVQWSATMRSLLTKDSAQIDGAMSRGSVIAVAGAKGGVGTTTVATHLAHHLVRAVRGRSVCLVDLDLESGDIGTLLGVTHRLDISDLAKVSDDLSVATINSALHRRADGVATLLAPSRLEDVGEVGERETVIILAALRQQFDIVIVDVGSHVTPSSAAAVEVASHAVLVTTPDVLSLRAVHRTLTHWQRFGAREPEQVSILLSQVSRHHEIQPDAAARLVPVAPLTTVIADNARALERGINHQNPEKVDSKDHWAAIDHLAGELGLLGDVDPQSSVVKPRRGLFGTRRAEVGQATLEFTALFPLALLTMALLWQVALWAVAIVYTGNAADEGARSAAIGNSSMRVSEDARNAVPGWIENGMSVSTPPQAVRVRTELPIFAPGLSFNGLSYTSTVHYVQE